MSGRGRRGFPQDGGKGSRGAHTERFEGGAGKGYYGKTGRGTEGHPRDSTSISRSSTMKLYCNIYKCDRLKGTLFRYSVHYQFENDVILEDHAHDIFVFLNTILTSQIKSILKCELVIATSATDITCIFEVAPEENLDEFTLAVPDKMKFATSVSLITIKLLKDKSKPSANELQLIFNARKNNTLAQLKEMWRSQDQFVDSNQFFLIAGRKYTVYPCFNITVLPFTKHASQASLQVYQKFMLVSNTRLGEYIRGLMRNLHYEKKNLEEKRKCIEDMLIGCFILTDHTYRVYRISYIDWPSSGKSAIDKTFMVKGVEMTYREYFAKKYTFKGNGDDFEEDPMIVHVDKREREHRLPASLCRLKGHPKGAPEAKDMKLRIEITKATRVSIADRFKAHTEMVERINNVTSLGPVKKLTINKEPLQVEGTNLLRKSKGLFTFFDAPQGSGAPSVMLSESGNLDARNIMHPVDINPVIVFHSQQVQNEANTLIAALKKRARQVNISFNVVPVVADSINTMRRKIRDGPQPFLVLFIASGKDIDQQYSNFKKAATFEKIVVRSQVVRASTIALLNDQQKLGGFIGNLFAQMQAKAGATLWISQQRISDELNPVVIGIASSLSLKLSNRKYWICGDYGDTLRPAFYSKVFACPMDQDCSYIQEFVAEIMEIRRKEFGAYPRAIFIYRQGNLNKEKDYIIKCEAHPIRQILKKISPKTSLIYIYTVLDSRMRFAKFEGGKYYNPDPMTFVNHVDGQEDCPQFYCSHQKVMSNATSSPTLYRIYYNDLENRNDILEYIQEVTATQSCMYFNWRGAIRCPAPLQYSIKGVKWLESVCGNDVLSLPQRLEKTLLML